jgi:hypothetical protein
MLRFDYGEKVWLFNRDGDRVYKTHEVRFLSYVPDSDKAVVRISSIKGLWDEKLHEVDHIGKPMIFHRLLLDGELYSDGDEIYADNQGWLKLDASFIGRPCRENLFMSRRKILNYEDFK